MKKILKGNGLVTLAHQLIAAKLIIANGADESAIIAVINDADNLIGNLVVGSDALDPSVVANDVAQLTAFNQGQTNVPSCEQ